MDFNLLHYGMVVELRLESVFFLFEMESERRVICKVRYGDELAHHFKASETE
jgi:hypothetical protein